MSPNHLRIAPDNEDEQTISPIMFIDHMEKLAYTDHVDHDDILNKMLDQIQPVDFVLLAGVEDKSKLNNRLYRILIIEQLSAMADKNGWGVCYSEGSVYVFNGAFWKAINEDQVKQFLGEAAIKMGVFWGESKDFAFRRQLLEQFMSGALYIKRPKDDSVMINLKNGTLEVRNGKYFPRPFDKRDFLTYQLSFEYDANATAPLFEEYLNYVLPEESKRIVLCEYMGYLFTRNLKLEKVLFAYGTGANGKSVLMEIITGMLGKENVSNVSLAELTDVEGKGRAKIADKIVNYLSETGPKVESSVFKLLASGEAVSAKLLYKDSFEITHYSKFIFNMNELPRQGVEQTDGFFRRLIIILFDVTVPEEKRDAELHKKIIQNELPGVLNWVLSGLSRIVENKAFSKSDAITKEVESFRVSSNPVALWIEETGYRKSDADFIKLMDLYREFEIYCVTHGHKHPPNIVTFSSRLKALGFNSEKKRDGKMVYITKV